MTDTEIVNALRAAHSESHNTLTGVELAERLTELLGGGDLTQGSLITYFQRCFPHVPLGIFIQAAAWARTSGGNGISDEEFNALLAPYLMLPAS